MRPPRINHLPAAARQRAALLLRRLAVLWHRPAVARLRVVVLARLRRTLGRYSLRTRRIELSPAVLSPKALTDVLTHEAAHAALAQSETKRSRPHGPEWRQLMAQAGQPDARATRWCRSNKPKATKPRPGNSRTRTYDHWCPVCQASRPARRAVRAWRCAACVAAGLEGRLEITAREAGAPQARPTQQAPSASAQP